MNWQDIPSLHALRAFEAVARRRNFTAAANDLNVTEAAVRQHVRGLEQWFGTSLAERSGKGLALTQNGDQLARITSDSFQNLASGVSRLLAREEDRPVTVALTPAFAEIWLMPKLDQFWRQYPDVEINLAPSLTLADPKSDQFDLAIRYGLGNWPGLEARFLASAEYVVVAKPGMVSEPVSRKLSSFKDYPWLFETTRQEHRDWANGRDIDFDADKNKFYPTNSLVLAAARAGHGLSLQARALVQTDLDLGSLQELYAEDNAPLGYYLVTRPNVRQKAKAFANWLLTASAMTFEVSSKD
ncbi:MAG: LysR family transcriptional regulator [Pseudomonadota bacterium]